MSAPETSALVLEIGCEEIPARFLEGAERQLGERLGLALRGARLLPQDAVPVVKTASTPRRLLVYAPALLRQQPGRVTKVMGPPVKAAFDKEGKPTRAAESFAAKNNANVSDLKRTTNEKGEYLALNVSEPGRSAIQVLVEILPIVLGGMSFPKNMYWTAKAGPYFVRPVRWILALLGDGSDFEVVPFEFAGVKTGSFTYGHRLQGSEPVAVTDLNLDILLEKHLVAVHGPARRKRAQEEIKALLEGSESKPVVDEWLDTWVVNSTEWPAPLIGSFDPRYLALPREVLVTVMRDHQKYFAVEDTAGNLQPQFITVLNVPGDPKGLIRQGHERVLAARFADAEFFWNADQKITLAERVPILERVTYQAKLGTYADKVLRMKAIAENVCATLEQDGRLTPSQRGHVLRAVDLCKCDLTTQMVQEFTELQGIMGGLYAKAQGEAAEVAEAIYDHYRPVGVEDSCPRSVAGALVSLADKLDSVVAGFAVGLEPTGSSDPFGLRRAGNGVVKVLVEQDIRLDLWQLARLAQKSFNTKPSADIVVSAADFLLDRLAYYLEQGRNLRYDTVRAMLRGQYWRRTGFNPFVVPAEAAGWGGALEKIRDTDDFRAIIEAAKRIRNIWTKSASESDRLEAGKVELNANLFATPEELELYNARIWMSKELERRPSGSPDCHEVFKRLAELRPAVGRFFDNVMVMDKDSVVRQRRLALLRALDVDVFSYFADLSEIVMQEEESRAQARDSVVTVTRPLG